MATKVVTSNMKNKKNIKEGNGVMDLGKDFFGCLFVFLSQLQLLVIFGFILDFICRKGVLIYD